MKHAAPIFSGSLLLASSVYGAAPAPDRLSPAPYIVPGAQPAPTSVSGWADRCTDFTINGWGFKDPKNFVKLMQVFSNPAIYLEFARRMQDPESYSRVASLMMDPRTAKNYLEWSDPTIYLKWMQAFIDPGFYLESMRPFLDPSTYIRWMALPVDQRAWSAGVNMMNPAMWMKWMTAGANPRVSEPLVKTSDPEAPIKWLQTAGDPANFHAWTEWWQTAAKGNTVVPYSAGPPYGMPATKSPMPGPEANSGTMP
jgi:hypothetical protein